MPKPPPVEYFMLRAPTPKELLGEAVAALTKIGLTEVNFDLMTDVPAFASRTNHTIKAEAFLEQWMADHPTFRAVEAIRAFKADGRTPGAGYTALRVMSADGRLTKLGEGMYSLPGVKQIAAPKKSTAKQTEKAKPKITRVHHDVDHREFILRYARQHNGRFSLAKIRDYFEKHNRKSSSVGGAINVLKERKLIKLLGDGEYVLLSKAMAAKPQPEPAKLNGAEPVTTTEETANG